MTFQGWTVKALDFYEGLEADNSKTYWTQHKAVYEADVREPMVELLAELEEEFGEGRIFRPLRDTRFSADKTPYKTATCATLSLGGFLQISGRGMAAGNGYETLAPDQLERYRGAVADDGVGEGLRELIADLKGRGIELAEGEQLKVAPRGYPKDHPRVDLLRRKGLIAWQDWPIETWLATPAAKDHVAEFLRGSRPVQEWLETHVGPTENPRHFGRRGSDQG
jgi:uncharacterized protein (TIGR02453 family)